MDPAEQSGAPRLILGTAGHIDHGKTALIRALTGVDTDRLPEERERGITIELGFAPLDLGAGLRLGVVDVPGHEGLVRTMVAGASGIDLVLLVVAADEGIMPQTREHVAICGLLGVEHAVVALTKLDIVDADLADLAEAEVRDYLAGTALTGADVLRVSSHSGQGIDALREVLAGAARAARTRTSRRGPPRLAVDRCFAAKGFGSVATGTLVGSELSLGDAVIVLPGGTRGRVRGLQSHGESTECVAPGARCAVNVQGVELAELPRGSVLTQPESFDPTTMLDVKLEWLDVAPEVERAAVELLVGTAERRARLAPIGMPLLVPGRAGFARLHVDGEPLPCVPGDRFIVRGFARTAMGGATLGGGVVIDTAPPRRRRSDPDLLRDLEVLGGGDASAALAVRIRRAGLAGIPEETLRRQTLLGESEMASALEKLAADAVAARSGAGIWLACETLSAIEARVEASLDAFHAAEPLQPGMPAAALRGSLPENVPVDVAELALARLAGRGAIVHGGDRVRRQEHRPQLSPEQEALTARIVSEAREAGLEPPALREWGERLDVDLETLRDLLAHLEREGALVRAAGELWFDRRAVDSLRERVIAHLRENRRLETPDYKALIGTSRRTAVPLMELFDEEHVTFRKGDARVLRDG
ncbi:MAG: selenocysteine-specific translation elongation factor [Deltaproteobacteria bacterium]|nr:selenocysteine-specific translation elongation factor [Deltaproteobacteria bacterium]MBW2360706.1 selenocysteine-specific translation elongation factor [Deltaproteobacteria bacterium]